MQPCNRAAVQAVQAVGPQLRDLGKWQGPLATICGRGPLTSPILYFIILFPRPLQTFDRRIRNTIINRCRRQVSSCLLRGPSRSSLILRLTLKVIPSVLLRAGPARTATTDRIWRITTIAVITPWTAIHCPIGHITGRLTACYSVPFCRCLPSASSISFCSMTLRRARGRETTCARHCQRSWSSQIGTTGISRGCSSSRSRATSTRRSRRYQRRICADFPQCPILPTN